jgi:hypothetical protein
MPIKPFALALAAIALSATTSIAEDAVVADEWEQQQAVGACDHLGTGFMKLPGTNTCARVSGQMRYEKHFSSRRGGDGTAGRMILHFETRSE